MKAISGRVVKEKGIIKEEATKRKLESRLSVQ